MKNESMRRWSRMRLAVVREGDFFAAAGDVPIQEVESDAMECVAVDGEINGKFVGGIPATREAADIAGVFAGEFGCRSRCRTKGRVWRC